MSDYLDRSRKSLFNLNAVVIEEVAAGKPANELLSPPDDPLETIRRYAEHRLKPVPGSEMPLSELHADYRSWCRSNGMPAMSLRELTDIMLDAAEEHDAIEVVTRNRKKMLLHTQFRAAEQAA